MKAQSIKLLKQLQTFDLHKMLEIPSVTKKDVSLEMTPLVDVVFLLLTFYMLTSTFSKENVIPINLPESQATISKPKEVLNVSIFSKDKVVVGKQTVTLSELEGVLANKIDQLGDDLKVTLRADKSGTVQPFISALGIVRSLKIKNFSIATK